jgi:hypothetical protein
MGTNFNYLVAIFLARVRPWKDIYYPWSSAFGLCHFFSLNRNKEANICFDEQCSGMACYGISRLWLLPLCHY